MIHKHIEQFPQQENTKIADLITSVESLGYRTKFISQFISDKGQELTLELFRGNPKLQTIPSDPEETYEQRLAAANADYNPENQPYLTAQEQIDDLEELNDIGPESLYQQAMQDAKAANDNLEADDPCEVNDPPFTSDELEQHNLEMQSGFAGEQAQQEADSLESQNELDELAFLDEIDAEDQPSFEDLEKLNELETEAENLTEKPEKPRSGRSMKDLLL